MENRISIEIPEADLKKLWDAVNTITKIITPLTPKLSEAQMRKMPYMADGTEPFVMKVLEFAESDPQFNPPYMDVPELKKDLVAFQQLTPVYVAYMQIADMLKKTYLVAGSEAYTTSLTYYNTVKLAAKVGVPGAKTVYDVLKKRFEQGGDNG